jgi:hypothetical protein
MYRRIGNAGVLADWQLLNNFVEVLSDAYFTIQDQADPTKLGMFDASGITTATTRTLKFPDANDTIAGIAAAQTLTNKLISGAANQIMADSSLLMAAAIGSTLKGQNFPYNLSLSNLAIAIGTAFYQAVWLPVGASITGVMYNIATNGNYTANNFNGVGLYTYDGAGNLTRVAVSANTATAWSVGTGIQKLAFTAPYVATAGLYFVGFMYSSSAHVTNPLLFGLGTAGSNNPLGTNSALLCAALASQTALASPTQAMSALTSNSSSFWAGLYT